MSLFSNLEACVCVQSRRCVVCLHEGPCCNFLQILRFVERWIVWTRRTSACDPQSLTWAQPFMLRLCWRFWKTTNPKYFARQPLVMRNSTFVLPLFLFVPHVFAAWRGGGYLCIIQIRDKNVCLLLWLLRMLMQSFQFHLGMLCRHVTGTSETRISRMWEINQKEWSLSQAPLVSPPRTISFRCRISSL